MKPTNDHFSALAEGYARHRPGYPSELFRFLAEQAPSREQAWDCATGSGQAAIGLAPHFDRVVATDGSPQQVAQAAPCRGVDYRVAPAEASGLPDASLDLITVAQALHWFDLDPFYAEVRRVLKPGGIIAVWSYNLLTIAPAVDAVVNHLYEAVVGPYWPAERRHVENGYRDLPFPFERVATPAFAMTAEWDLGHLLGYLQTWSATRRFREAQGEDPVETIREALEAAWGEPHATRQVRWPLRLRVGRLG